MCIEHELMHGKGLRSHWLLTWDTQYENEVGLGNELILTGSAEVAL